MRKSIILSLALFMLMTFPVFAKSVVGVGFGINSDIAEKNALRDAVENAVGTYVDSVTLSEKQQIIEDRILTHSQGYVTDYKVLNIKQKKDGWQVKIQAEIDPKADAKLLSELAKQGIINVVLRNPKIAVAVNLRENSATGNWAEEALTESLITAGFKRAYIGEDDGSDFVVIGKAYDSYGGDIGKFVGNGKHKTGTKSAKVILSVQLYQRSTGKTIALGQKIGRAVGTDKCSCLHKAAKKAGEDMGQHIVEQLLILGSGPALQEQ